MSAAILALAILGALQPAGQVGRENPETGPGSARTQIEPGTQGTVIKPPGQVDPGIKAPIPPQQAFPMPVVKPPATQTAPQPMSPPVPRAHATPQP